MLSRPFEYTMLGEMLAAVMMPYDAAVGGRYEFAGRAFAVARQTVRENFRDGHQ